MKARFKRVKDHMDDVSGSRTAARVTLWIMGVLMGLFVLVGPSFGSSMPAAMQSSSPSPSGTGGAPEASIAFLNPAQSYDPGLPRPARSPGAPDRPKVSDRFDGVDRTYHIVAGASQVPENSIVEAYILYGTNPEITIGLLDRVPNTNVWELKWDVPESLNEGNATMIVRMYSQTASGITEVAAHEVLVDMQHKGGAPPTPPDTQPADETVEITWPADGGQLGFYNGGGGANWRTVIDGFASSRSEAVDAFYSVTPLGKTPQYKPCGALSLYDTPQYDSPGDFTENPQAGADVFAAEHQEIPFAVNCTLAGKDVPTAVTAVALVPLETDEPNRSEARVEHDELTQDSADAHNVDPYVQDKSQMNVSLLPSRVGDYTAVRRRTTGNNNCLAYMVTVTDHLGRPVQGANVDVHMEGPTDQAQFGDENSAAASANGTYKAPDKGEHAEESGRDCDANANQGLQGDHNRPGAPDVKHREAAGGTGGAAGGGSPGGTPPLVGQWRFHVYSRDAGISRLTAWVDDGPMVADKREADDDLLTPDEPVGTNFAQWYAAAPTVDVVPAGGTSPAGSCFEYIVKARSGTAPIAGMNVDVHATGPDDSLDFCDVADQSVRRSPDRGPASNATPHEAEEDDEAAHVQPSPRSQHTESETDDAGNFVFGLTSPVVGDTTVTVWLDGEKDFINTSKPDTDNDILDSGETTKTFGHTWSTGAGNAKISWMNPSGYGASSARTGGDQIGKKPDADSLYHLVARVDSVEEVVGVDFLVSTDGTTFTPIGAAQRVGTSDTWELYWDMVNVTDGNRTLRALITGTAITADRQVFINNSPTATDPSDVPLETVEITSPTNSGSATFDRRALTVQGVASSGADGVDLFYTKVPGRQTPESGDWSLCGFVDLNGTSSTPQGFRGSCTLNGADQPAQVTGVAAIAMDCISQNNCDAAVPQPPQPGAPAPPRQAARDSGDAHRVFGIEANPLISIEPPEVAQSPNQCQRLVLTVLDQTGQPVPNRNVDVHISGPSDDVRFCTPTDGDPHRAPDSGEHTAYGSDPTAAFHSDPSSDVIHAETETDSSGRFIFGVVSSTGGDTTVVGWVENPDDDVMAPGENSDQSIIHWDQEPPSGSCTIVGTAGRDRLEGTSGDDVICAKDGRDVLLGRGGNDILKGGGKPDRLLGGGGADKLFGKRGGDELRGGAGGDTLSGDRGDDYLDGGPGQDRCDGGPNVDRLQRCE